MRLHERLSLVVTGGSSGIGAAVCLAAARAGWHVWIGYARGGDRAAALAAAITD
jgi:NAD(P)-dependent dehydrogenase (short-subunit alcohol dehydrogenase family)